MLDGGGIVLTGALVVGESLGRGGRGSGGRRRVMDVDGKGMNG